MPFIHLQVHSAFSLLNSSIKLSELVQKSKELGFNAIALTDENVMYGAVTFYKLCMKFGIKPIIGLTASIIDQDESDSFPLILLAKNNEGYHNLMKISSTIQTKGLKGIPKRWLLHYSKGVIAISPGNGGEIESYLRDDSKSKARETALSYQKLFEGEFYLSIQNHHLSEEVELNNKLEDLATELGLDIVAINNIHYLKKQDAFAHDCLQAIKSGSKLDDEERVCLPNDEFYLKSEQQMKELFKEFPESIKNTLKISNKCHLELEFGQSILPKYPVPNPENQSAFEYLSSLCIDGLAKRVPNNGEQYLSRLQYELSIIDKMSFSDYFLIVWDFMKFAHQNGILTGPGRGSAAGSLVAYVLSITDIDPLEHGLIFERFLNPERISMPDIDIDFPDNRRDEMIEYVAKKYGQLHVAQIITFGTFGAKAAIRDAGRVMGMPVNEIDYFSKLIPNHGGITLKEAYEFSHQLRQHVETGAATKKVFETALTLEGLPRHTSTHAAGVVISGKPLTDVIPIQTGRNNIYLTQYTMNLLEEIGLLKMDFLGLRNLTLIDEIVKAIKKETGKKINLLTIPLNDSKVFHLLSNGDTTGIFQLESEGMKSVLERLKPTEFNDIVAVNALYRPGPMENIPAYIERKAKIKPINYPHPDLEPILKKTYGVIVYQEQIIQIAAKMASFSLGEADLLRRAVSKKKKEILDKERAHFVKGCTSNGYSLQDANEVYDLIVRFANYGFNQSHAVAYSFISYQLAYLKAHYPLFFYASLLSSVIGNDEKTALYIKEAKHNGIKILIPSINHSDFAYKVESGGIRFSLAALKNVGMATLKEIFQQRKQKPFRDLFDFCIRTSTKVVNRRILESFVLSGAFDEFEVDRAVLLASLDIALEHAELFGPKSGEHFDLFPSHGFTLAPKYVMVEPFKEEDKLKYEKEVLGFYLSSHPITHFSELFKRLYSTDIYKLIQPGLNHVKVGAYISSLKAIRTKKGEVMAFIVLSDETGDIDSVAFPTTYSKNMNILQKGNIVFLEGTMEYRQNKHQFIIKKVTDIQKLTEKIQQSPKLYLKIEKQYVEYINLASVKKVLKDFPGISNVIIYYEQDDRTIQLPEEYSVNPTALCLNRLKKIIGEKNVVLK